MSRDLIEDCLKLINEAKVVGALTGAGISTSAGIPDFRGPRGLYITRQYDPDKVFDINYFHHDPRPFFAFARDFLALEQKISPTPAHRFLSRLEASGKLKGVITQNIDALHQKAGSKAVFEMHGGISQSRCLSCGAIFSYEQMKEKLALEEIPQCHCGNVIKPEIVFFGEEVKCLNESMHLAEQSDLFFVIGTSCVVYPAAMIPDLVNGKIVIVNLSDVHKFNGRNVLAVKGDIDEFFQKLGQRLFNETL